MGRGTDSLHQMLEDGAAARRYALNVRNLIRSVPGAQKVSLLRQRIKFTGSVGYWESNYSRGGTSGDGSYGELARGKAAFLNAFVRDRSIRSVVEFGCGDGNQLSLAEYPRYAGLDVSPRAIALCKQRFARDSAKSFFCYDTECFVDQGGWFSADLALSLDVVYHLIEDTVFETYMRHLFAASNRYAVIYSTNAIIPGTAPHVRHRHFTPWVEAECPAWRLVDVTPGPNMGPACADFFVYERATPSHEDTARVRSGHD